MCRSFRLLGVFCCCVWLYVFAVSWCIHITRSPLNNLAWTIEEETKRRNPAPSYPIFVYTETQSVCVCVCYGVVVWYVSANLIIIIIIIVVVVEKIFEDNKTNTKNRRKFLILFSFVFSNFLSYENNTSQIINHHHHFIFNQVEVRAMCVFEKGK